MKQIFQYMKSRKLLSVMVLIMLSIQAVGTLLIPFMIADLINLVEHVNIGGSASMESVVHHGVAMVVVLLITTVFSVWGCYLCAEFALGFGKNLRKALFQKTQDLSLAEFESFGTSSLLTRTTTDITIIQRTSMLILQMIAPTPILLIAAVVFTLKESVRVGVIVMGLILCFVAVATIILKNSISISQRIQALMDKINRILGESLVGIRVIRAFNKSQYERERNDRAASEYADNMIALNKLFSFLNPTVWLLMGLVMVAVIWFAGGPVLQGSMEIGSIVSITEYSIIALIYLVSAAATVVTIPKMANCLNRISSVLNTISSIQDSTALPQQAGKEPLRRIAFDRVSFAYDQAQEKVLSDISFTCESGTTTAIIGSTGSGKSSVAKILLRLYDIQSGNILLNGKQLTDFSQQLLREKIAYVPQKAFLFSGTIADNLKMGKKDATEEEMWRALRIAQAESFVSKLPKQLESPVSQGGTNFSGGQRQRLAIARAIIRPADVYIFDDSFSALDFKTDRALRAALKENIRDAIVLIIAQRINTILQADQIVVLDQGRVVGIGTHQELLKTCRIYHEIAKSQIDLEVQHDNEK